MRLAFINDVRTLAIACVLLLSAATAVPAQELVTMTGGASVYVVRPGDTLASVAARFAMSVPALVAANGLGRPNTIAPGQTLSVDNAHLAVVDAGTPITINIAQRMLFFAADGRVSGYPITVGQSSWPTPVGSFTIVDKERDPVWDVPVSIQREMEQQGKPVITRMPPSPQNPLGAHWLRLSIPSLGIHGTNAPSSIYRYGSHGCIRMHPEHIAELFERVAIGTAGVLKYEPIILAPIGERVWLEVHPDPYRRRLQPERYLREMADRLALGHRVDWNKAIAALRERAGRPADVTAGAP
ncbi:MAG TPA: L,D-transpeptidase family protein [Vicinamibacterales bacterium]